MGSTEVFDQTGAMKSINMEQVFAAFPKEIRDKLIKYIDNNHLAAKHSGTMINGKLENGNPYIEAKHLQGTTLGKSSKETDKVLNDLKEIGVKSEFNWKENIINITGLVSQFNKPQVLTGNGTTENQKRDEMVTTPPPQKVVDPLRLKIAKKVVEEKMSPKTLENKNVIVVSPVIYANLPQEIKTSITYKQFIEVKDKIVGESETGASMMSEDQFINIAAVLSIKSPLKIVRSSKYVSEGYAELKNKE